MVEETSFSNTLPSESGKKYALMTQARTQQVVSLSIAAAMSKPHHNA